MLPYRSVLMLVVIGTAMDYWINDDLRSLMMILLVFLSLVILTVLVVSYLEVIVN